MEYEREREDREVLNRVRRLLRFAGKKVEAGRGHKKPLRKQHLSQLEHWKNLFLKFDKLKSGHLTIKQFQQLVRCALKLSPRVLTNEDLDALVRDLDLDGDGDISFSEFSRFIEEESDDDTLDPAVAKSVGRALRLALRRKHLLVDEIQDHFDLPLHDDGMVRFADLVDLFRHDLGISRHECSDKSILKAFYLVGSWNVNMLSKEDAMDFVRSLWHVGDGISNVDGDSQRLQPGGEHVSQFLMHLGGRQPSRCGSRPTTGGQETLPFRTTGRERAPFDRLTASAPCSISRPMSQAASRPMTEQGAVLLPFGLSTMSSTSGRSDSLEVTLRPPATVPRTPSGECQRQLSPSAWPAVNRPRLTTAGTLPEMLHSRSEAALPPGSAKQGARPSLAGCGMGGIDLPPHTPKAPLETVRSMTPSMRSPPSSSPRPGSSARVSSSQSTQAQRSERYFWLRGGRALNRVQQRLVEVGVNIHSPPEDLIDESGLEGLLLHTRQKHTKLPVKLPPKINKMLIEELNKGELPQSLSDALEPGDSLEIPSGLPFDIVEHH